MASGTSSRPSHPALAILDIPSTFSLLARAGQLSSHRSTRLTPAAARSPAEHWLPHHQHAHSPAIPSPLAEPCVCTDRTRQLLPASHPPLLRSLQAGPAHPAQALGSARLRCTLDQPPWRTRNTSHTLPTLRKVQSLEKHKNAE